MIPMFDARAELLELGVAVDVTIQRVLGSGWFILGDEVRSFENEFAAYLGCRHAVGVGSGTEALQLALVAAGIGAGDEVITVPNTAVATVAAIEAAGARPVFADIDPDSFLMRADLLDRCLTTRTRAIVPVHLYGQVADMDRILEFARQHSLAVVEDACQAHGARYDGKQAGTLGDLGCFSFYPSKNLGAVGDGGMVSTNDDALADRLRLLRQYGWRSRDNSEIRGINSRLDEIQAAVLRVKLTRLEARNARRRNLAERYLTELADTSLILPVERAKGRTNWHLFVVKHPQRDRLREFLADHDIASAVHYPTPIYLQQAYRDLGLDAGTCPVSEEVQREILSLPLFAELTDDQQSRVIAVVRQFDREHSSQAV